VIFAPRSRTSCLYRAKWGTSLKAPTMNNQDKT